MKYKSYRKLILVLIFQSQGKWSWYQLERELDWRGIGGQVNVVEVVNKLVEEKMVIKKIDSNAVSGIAYYSVTRKGSDYVYELLDQCGAETFTRKRECPQDYR